MKSHLWTRLLVVMAGAALSSTALAAGLDAKSEARDLYKQGAYARALEKFRTAAQEHPQDASIFWQLGFTYRKLSRFNEALSSFEKAGKLDPTHSFTKPASKYDEIVGATRTKVVGATNTPPKATAPSGTTLSKLPEVIALKNGNVYVDDSRRGQVDTDRLQAVALELKGRGPVKFLVTSKDYPGKQLARYAASIHAALGLGKGYLLAASPKGAAAASKSQTPDALQAASYKVAGQIRRGEITAGLEKLARTLAR